MKRTDNEYWQRLRRDKPSGFAAVLTVFAWLVPVVALGMLVAPGTQADARGNPFYWLIMVPLAWWTAGLTRYEPAFVRFLVPAQITAPVVAAIAAGAAVRSGEDATPFWIATVMSALAAGGGWLLYRNSMLHREGPAR